MVYCFNGIKAFESKFVYELCATLLTIKMHLVIALKNFLINLY